MPGSLKLPGEHKKVSGQTIAKYVKYDQQASKRLDSHKLSKTFTSSYLLPRQMRTISFKSDKLEKSGFAFQRVHIQLN